VLESVNATRAFQSLPAYAAIAMRVTVSGVVNSSKGTRDVVRVALLQADSRMAAPSAVARAMSGIGHRV
jgi:hypothetical protein